METQIARSWTPSTLAFASEGPFLAAGTTSDGDESPSLRIIRATPGPGALEVVATFPSPAPFCRVAWSKALAYGCSTSPVGLIAGGLESGVVMVWDSQHKLRDWDPPFYHDDELVLKENLQSGRFMSRDFKLIEDHFAPEKLREPPALPPRISQTTRNLMPGSVTTGVVAAFRPRTSPVRGLSFSSCSPALLASGTEEGHVLVWDLTNQLAQPVPTFECVPSPSVNISSLAWSKLRPNVLACTSFGGTTSVLDLSSKSPVFSFCECKRRCSAVDFSPVNENLLLVSYDDCLPLPSLLAWDLRKMNEPVNKFCQDSQGVNAISWSPWNDDSLVVTTNNRKAIVLDVQNKQVTVQIETPNQCFDVHWSKASESTFVTASMENLTMYQLK